MIKGNALVAQTGGPTTVINSTLTGVISQSQRESDITSIFGCHWGMLGLIKSDFIDLSRLTASELEL
ncbi:MAG: 6-phosphofructokinase, partial [Candidatus Delongbacteria bacterium]|nr:6-phosphofructokinase [Candidatus Delongbacteria bacterium]